jgi:hypothetical protein
VVLDDGSIWIVAAGDQATTSVWVDASSIAVNDSSSGSGYDLVNTDDQDVASANFIGQE